MFLSLVAFLFGLITAVRYNSVPVNVVCGFTSFLVIIFLSKERKGTVSKTETVRKNSVSNTMWILYFFSLCLRGSFDALRFVFYHENEPHMDDALSLVSLCFFGLSVFCLTLALEHQRKYRSHFKKRDSVSINPSHEPETDGDEGFTAKKCHKLIVLLRIPITLLTLYLISIFLGFFLEHEALFYVFLTAYSLQRIPLLILCCIIVFTVREENEGPSILSRIFLLVGLLLDLINEIPITIWSYMITLTLPANSSTVLSWTAKACDVGPDRCVIGGIASLVDVVHILFLISQLLFFVFLRNEFIRNKDPCVWMIVSKRHEGYFDFREFQDEEEGAGQSHGSKGPNEFDKMFNTAKKKGKHPKQTSKDSLIF